MSLSRYVRSVFLAVEPLGEGVEGADNERSGAVTKKDDKRT